MDHELREHLIGLEERLKSYLDERCEQVETRLLTEFHKWASPSESRARAVQAAIRAIDAEIESLQDRVRSFEDRRPTQ